MQAEEFDVLIVGAGISGVGAGVHLQKSCPGKSYVILEARDAIGGTWDLFRYPGIRSDSDMYTLGYRFKPWREREAIAGGTKIRNYVQETAREYGIADNIRFKHHVKRASWSSEKARWTVEAEHGGQRKLFSVKFLLMGAGYYSYDNPYMPEFKGRERFAGTFLHAQHWPEGLDYTGKRVVIIGSGATAVTMAPAMTDKAAHVTMLQRSPTYMASLPAVDPVATFLQRVLPVRMAYHLIRAMRAFLTQFFFRFARRKPLVFRERLLKRVREQLPAEEVEANFTPRYMPWEQRLCLVPDNDMFIAVREGKASVVTDTIDTFTEKGVKLSSGQELEADIIVAATGLNLQLLGGAEVFVDGAKVETGKTFAYKGAMFSGVPNLVSVFGYLNASWTLRADLINEYMCRLLNYMDEFGYDQATPVMREPNPTVKDFADFSSGYFQRANHFLPKQSGEAPWKQGQSYPHDIMDLRYGAIADGVLEFRRLDEVADAPRETVAAE